MLDVNIIYNGTERINLSTVEIGFPATAETLSEQVFPGGYSRLKRMWNLPDFHFHHLNWLFFLSKPFTSSSTESCFHRPFATSCWQWWPSFLTRENWHISKKNEASTQPDLKHQDIHLQSEASWISSKLPCGMGIPHMGLLCGTM